MTNCTCSYIRVGNTLTMNRTWRYDCPEHGIASHWYQSPEQKLARREAAAKRKVLAELAAKRRASSAS